MMPYTEKHLTNYEILCVILSGIAPRTEINNLEGRLENLFRTETKQVIRSRFQEDLRYCDFPELHSSIVLMESCGLISGLYSGMDCISHKVNSSVYRTAQSLKPQIESETFAYLKTLGSNII